MAGLPSIDTGYKPEFSLGALYQGMNAANADMSAQEELIRQFLANQRETAMHPLDVGIKQFEANKANVQNTPEMLAKFGKSTEAGYNKAIREDELQSLTHNFKVKQAPVDAQRDLDYSEIDSEIANIQDTLRRGVGDNGIELGAPLQDDLQLRLQELISRRGFTPQHWGARDLQQMKDANDLEKQRLANQGHISAASITANKGQQEEYLRGANTISALIRSNDSNLARLDSAEAKTEIANMILSSGGEPTEQAINQRLNERRRTLETEKAGYISQMQAYHKAAGMPVPTQVTPPPVESPTLQDVRAKYPQYSHISDADLKKALEAKGIKVQ